MAKTIDEIGLLQGIYSGEEWAFKYLFEHYFAPLCQYASKFFPAKEETESIVQEVMLSIFENRAKLGDIQNIKAYLYRAVHYQCVNHIKKEQVRKRFEDEESYQLKMIELENDSTDESEERIAAIISAIEELPDQQKKAFTLKRIDGKSYKEISAELNIAERTVETHISLALKFLRKRLLPSATATGLFIHFISVFLHN